MLVGEPRHHREDADAAGRQLRAKRRGRCHRPIITTRPIDGV
jgi:hypothetical protein